MNKVFLFAATLGISGVAFGADKPIQETTSPIVVKVEVNREQVSKISKEVREQASELNKKVVKPTIQNVKETYKTEVKPTVQKTVAEVKTTASKLNEKRKKWKL